MFYMLTLISTCLSGLLNESLNIFSACSLRKVDAEKIRLYFFFVYTDATGFSWRGSEIVRGNFACMGQ